MLKLTAADVWKPLEYWKLTVAQCPLNAVETIRREMENCNEDYEAVACRKEHSRRSPYTRIYLRTAGESDENPRHRMRDLVREMGGAIFIMNLALNEDLSYTKEVNVNFFFKKNVQAKKLLNPVTPATIQFFSDEKNFCHEQLRYNLVTIHMTFPVT